eukprot:6199744-Pleurochrysis_carterae.AAC.3
MRDAGVPACKPRTGRKLSPRLVHRLHPSSRPADFQCKRHVASNMKERVGTAEVLLMELESEGKRFSMSEDRFVRSTSRSLTLAASTCDRPPGTLAGTSPLLTAISASTRFEHHCLAITRK